MALVLGASWLNLSSQRVHCFFGQLIKFQLILGRDLKIASHSNSVFSHCALPLLNDACFLSSNFRKEETGVLGEKGDRS